MPGVRLLREPLAAPLPPFSCDSKLLLNQWAYLAQSSDCQVSAWSGHRFGCSPLPSGKLVPVPVSRDRDMDRPYEDLVDSLKQLMYVVRVSKVHLSLRLELLR